MTGEKTGALPEPAAPETNSGGAAPPSHEYSFADIAQNTNDFIPMPAWIYAAAIAVLVLCAAGLFFAVKKIRARWIRKDS